MVRKGFYFRPAFIAVDGTATGSPRVHVPDRSVLTHVSVFVQGADGPVLVICDASPLGAEPDQIAAQLFSDYARGYSQQAQGGAIKWSGEIDMIGPQAFITLAVRNNTGNDAVVNLLVNGYEP